MWLPGRSSKRSVFHLKSESLLELRTKFCLGDEEGQLTVTLSLDLSEDLKRQGLPVVIPAWESSSL